jgi:polyhydroxyalkanoate synthase subunit PhaC
METLASWRPFFPLPAALIAEQQRLWRNVWHLPRVVEQGYSTEVGTTPRDVVLRNGRFKLLRYRRSTPARYAQPVLFCYALINRPYILDLLPGKSVVGRYLEEGFDVYMIDWGVPGHADRGLDLEGHVCGFLKEAASFILREHRREDLHLLGYCMGGTMAVLFAALHPEAMASLTLLAAPLDFSGSEALLHLWSDEKRFDVDAFIDTHGNCPGWFLQACFLAMKPVQNLLEKNIALYEQLDDPEAVAGYFAMERWLNDNIPVPGETFREFVKNLYQGNQLVRGELQVGDRRIELGRIRCPLLLLTAAKDHLVAPASTEGLRPHVSSKDIRSIGVEAGHVGLIVGSRARRTMWPEATRWLADRSM